MDSQKDMAFFVKFKFSTERPKGLQNLCHYFGPDMAHLMEAPTTQAPTTA